MIRRVTSAAAFAFGGVLGNLIFAFALLIAGCGGGGGGASAGPRSGGIAPQTAAPVTAPPTPSPTASPTPTPAFAPITGSVADIGNQRYAGDGQAPGVGISGATVIVGSVVIVGSTPPPSVPSGDVSTTTDATGKYTINGIAASSATYVMVFPPANATKAYFSSHALARVSNGTIRTLYLSIPTIEEQNEFAQVLIDRSTNGAGPVIADEIATETARAHGDFMGANGYNQHCIPATNCIVGAFSTTAPASFAPMFASPDDIYNALGGAVAQPPANNFSENFTIFSVGLGFTGSWAAADAGFMSEKPTNGGHYANIVNTSRKWVGLGTTANGLPFTLASGTVSSLPVSVYVQEFYSPIGV